MPVSRRLRFEILRRDNHTCRYCGASAPDVKLTVDHVNPSALGGEDRPENLVTACAGCNGGKSSIPPDAGIVANVAADALRWSSAIRVAADGMLADLDRRNEIRADFDEAWRQWGVGSERDRTPVPRPDGWEHSIDSFMAAGLPMPVLLDCMRKAMSNKKLAIDAVFRYMCGIAWKKVSELQDAASGMVSSEGGSEPLETEGVDHFKFMYLELVGHIFGFFGGFGQLEDIATLATHQRIQMEEDEDSTCLDEDGLAALAILSVTADTFYVLRESAQILLLRLPEERFQELHSLSREDLDWTDEMQAVDHRHFFKNAIAARMLALTIPPDDDSSDET